MGKNVHGYRHIDLPHRSGRDPQVRVTATVSGIELATVGTILIIVGIVGLVISLIFMMQAGRGAVVTRDRVVERDPYVDPRI